ncbi:MAG: hypothetical protein AB2693_19460 [Candidatus Thiodiazotropha sp.]
MYHIKLTPHTDWRNFTEDMLETEIFQRNLHKFINNFTQGARTVHLRVYRTDLNLSDKSFLLIQIVIGASSDSGDIVSDIFLTVHSKSFQLFQNIRFIAEMVMFDIDFNEAFHAAKYLDIPTPTDQSQIQLEPMPFQGEKLFNLSSLGCYWIGDIYKLLVCPFLQLQFDETIMEIENDFLTIKGNLSTVTLSKWDFRIGVNNTIIICLEDFLKVKGEVFGMPILNVDVENGSFHPKQILSFVCICISIVCLLITITTYFMLSTLQSQPVINNVILRVALLLAQTFYQF